MDSDFIIFCPYHNNYRTPAAEVSKERGTFFCFSCQESRSLLELVMHVTQKSYFQALRMIESCGTKMDVVGVIDDILEDKQELLPFDELLIKRLHTQALESPRAMRYLEGRRLSVETIKKFQLGYSEKQDMITIPVHDPMGTMYYGFVGRSVEGKEFKNTTGNWRSQTLFNIHRARRHSSVYLVESAIDAMRLDENDVPAVATLGAYVSKPQIKLLEKYFNSVILIADNDEGGSKMIDKVSKRIGDRLSVIGIPKRFKDVGDMTDSDIGELVKRVDNPMLAML